VNLIIILADSELEPVPDEVRDPAACSLPILDAYFHRELIKKLPEGSRRGRPDIVHSSLLLCQTTAPFREGKQRVFIHTRHDKVIAVSPGAEAAPNYIKFLFDMDALLKGEKVPGYDLTDRSLPRLMSDLRPDRIMALTPNGQEISLQQYFHDYSGRSLAVVIGGFPEGDFKSPVYELADDQISLGPRLMRVPEVVATVLHALHNAAQK
jgi:rRNA small subunit pseudouridine methyltransferase Nep1